VVVEMKAARVEARSRRVSAEANLTTTTALHQETMWTLAGVREEPHLDQLLQDGETSLHRLSGEIPEFKKESHQLNGAMLHQRIKTKVDPAAGERLPTPMLAGETMMPMEDLLQLEVRCQMITEAEAEVATEEATMEVTEAVAAEAAPEHASSATRKVTWPENVLIQTLEMEETEEEAEASVEAKVVVEVAPPATIASKKDTWQGSAPTQTQEETAVAEVEEAQEHASSATKKDTWPENVPIQTQETAVAEVEADHQEAEMIMIGTMEIQAPTSVKEETTMTEGGDKALITGANQTMKLILGEPQEVSLRQVEEMMAVLGVARILVDGARTPSPSLPSQAGERIKIVSLFILA
jgi:hypothetical protein